MKTIPCEGMAFHRSLGDFVFFLGNNSATAHGSFGLHQERHGHPREKWICKSESRERGDRNLQFIINKIMCPKSTWWIIGPNNKFMWLLNNYLQVLFFSIYKFLDKSILYL